MSSIRAYILNWDLATKFRIVASAPWAEPLGMYGLTPEKEYPVLKFERVGGSIQIYYLFFTDRNYTRVGVFPIR